MGSSFQKIRGVLVFCSLLQSGLNWQWENSACPTAEVNGASVYYEAAHRPFQRLGSAAFRYCHDSRTPAISMCHAGGWYPPIDGCGQGVSEISKVTCRKLAVHKGYAEYSDNLRPSSVATINCLDGYGVHGTLAARCEANGEWSNELGWCELIQCPVLNVDASVGFFVYTKDNAGNERTVGSTVIQHCRLPYIPSGVNRATCKFNGEWSTVPASCTKLIHPDVCPRFNMINGQVKYNGKIIVEGTTAIVSCEAGYKTRSIASGIARCQRSGKWTVELRCEPVDECPSMTVPGGHVRYEFDGKPAQTIKEGTIAVLTCSSGFAVGAIPQSVCYGSSWHPENIGPCNI